VNEDNTLDKPSALAHKELSFLQSFLIYKTLGGSQAVCYYNSCFTGDKMNT
jgi:hypothetical protein